MPRIMPDSLEKRVTTLEALFQQLHVDRQRLWKRISQTPQNYVGGPFVAANSGVSTGTTTTTTTTTTTVGPTTTLGPTTTTTTTTTTLPQCAGSCDWQWIDNGISGSWSKIADTCVGSALNCCCKEPNSVGAFPNEIRTTFCNTVGACPTTTAAP